ncbi:MAG: serine hydrolase domain-containing protein, partial [Pikeienuella sp.]
MNSFDNGRLKRIDTWMQRYVEQGKFPGSTMMLAQGGNVVHRATVGLRDIDSGTPFEQDTIVRIYSMTKPITTVALMTLVEKGLFHLEAPISDFIPEFANARALIPGATSLGQTEPCAPPTVHQVATHTSGLTYSFNPGLLAGAYKEHQLDFGPDGPGLAQVAQKVASQPLSFHPGSRWEYSVGIDILGRIIEVVSGKTLAQFFADEIFEPLGMKDTHFTLPDDQARRFASLYTSSFDDPMGLGQKVDQIICRQVDNATDSPYRTTSTYSGGGGLLSTADDYFCFAEMLRQGGSYNGQRILSPATLSFMQQNHLPGDIASMGPKSFAEMPMHGVGFGLGWA